MFYLAYGMNTNVKQMDYRCPDAISYGRYDLEDHRLVFRKSADIEYSPGDTLQCVLWDITYQCEYNLDMLEGFPYHYDKKIVDIIYRDKLEEAMIYYMIGDEPYRAPTFRYQYMLEEGYDDHGLDLNQIYTADGFSPYFQYT